MSYIKEVLSSRELLVNLTMREVKGKYKRTVFGQLWSLANPLAAMLIYTFVFAFIFKAEPDRGDPSGLDIFALWLLCGLLPWTFLATTINAGMNSLIANTGLIQKVSFSRMVLPLSNVGATAYNWLFEMAVLLIALSIAGAFVLPWIPMMLVVMALLAIFAAGIALMLAIANVHFRDTANFVGILLQIWMYLTPIIYPLNLVQDLSDRAGPLLGTELTVYDVFKWNPMENFVEVFRQLLYDNRWPDVVPLVSCVLWSFVVFAIGVLVFRRHEKNLAEAL
ncbi:MAG TPA: ABC transporter permease [Glaciihabitans sp.]|jgi:ABC-2 type transport system permease protein|nr:ABC transporter permease [Glaciihabitans sp.]